MTYDITIGNRKGKRVEDAEHPDAPIDAANGLSGKSNYRSAAYGAFTDWAEEVGLDDMWFDEKRGFLRDHGKKRLPIVTLNRAHLVELRAAKAKWEADHPGCDFKKDYAYGRLVWFEFWFDWALTNCVRPAVSNN